VCSSITSSQANQIFNAYIERFNRTYREAVLNMYLLTNATRFERSPADDHSSTARCHLTTPEAV
jgi:hypothetical protein